jgi:hypothetical protein
MNKISSDFRNTTIEVRPLGANLVLGANTFLEKLPQHKGFRTLPLMSNLGDRLEAMLLIPESQMKDLIIPPKLINRGITALNDRWHGRNTDELIFRSIKVSPSGDLGDKTELVTFSRKAFLTVLSDPKSLQLIESKLKDSKYSPENVFEAYKQVQVRHANREPQGSPPVPMQEPVARVVPFRQVVVSPAPVSPPTPADVVPIGTGRPNDNPGDDRQGLLKIGVSLQEAFEHGALITY